MIRKSNGCLNQLNPRNLFVVRVANSKLSLEEAGTRYAQYVGGRMMVKMSLMRNVF